MQQRGWRYHRDEKRKVSKWILGNNWVTKWDKDNFCIIGTLGKRDDYLMNHGFTDPSKARAAVEAVVAERDAIRRTNEQTDRQKEAGIAYVSDILVDVRLKGNRWNFLRAIISPRVAHIRLRQCSAAIFVSPPPSQTGALSNGGEAR